VNHGVNGALTVMTLMAGFLQDQPSASGLSAAAICGGFGQGDAVVLERI